MGDETPSKELIVAGPLHTIVPSPYEAGVLTQAGTFTIAKTGLNGHFVLVKMMF
jgi:hypothetical protein